MKTIKQNDCRDELMMRDENYRPSVVDFAYEIIDMHEENKQLRRELEHYKKLDKIHRDQLNTLDQGHSETMGIILGAVLDPESAINKADRIIIENNLKEA